jgi:hypothetical protein
MGISTFTENRRYLFDMKMNIDPSSLGVALVIPVKIEVQKESGGGKTGFLLSRGMTIFPLSLCG